MALAVMVAGASLFSSCAKEGPAGPAGPAGTNGKDGNANVKSQSYFITGSEWTYASAGASLTKLMPQITADIIANGVVMVYTKPSSSGTWDAMPTAYTDASGVVLSLGYSIETGKLNLYFTWNTAAQLTAADVGNNDFRVVVISGSALARHPEVNVRDYKQVEAILATE